MIPKTKPMVTRTASRLSSQGDSFCSTFCEARMASVSASIPAKMGHMMRLVARNSCRMSLVSI